MEALARRMAATMPHSIDIGDLVQDGVIGLIDAAHRFDESRGIKFETFAERRIRGAMIDALRKDAWPRGVRRQRRELEAAREELRSRIPAYMVPAYLEEVPAIPMTASNKADLKKLPKPTGTRVAMGGASVAASPSSSPRRPTDSACPDRS